MDTLPSIRVEYAPKHKDDANPYLAVIVFPDETYHAAIAPTAALALLRAAARWESNQTAL